MPLTRDTAEAGQPSWICCQLGAREHYAVPRALLRAGRAVHVLTDTWVPPQSVASRLIRGSRGERWRERYHPELANAPMTAFTGSLMAHEIGWRLRGLQGWRLFEARNGWFQREAAAAIDAFPAGLRAIVFAHSYSALEIFRRAKARGWRLVLGQIDPGARHFRIVEEAARHAPEYGPPPPAPSHHYLADWRAECGLADHIAVNSEWSRSCLEAEGIPASKLAVVPLAYEPDATSGRTHAYPEAFSASRPIRLLFVGQVAVAKGIKALLDATAQIGDLPFELVIVGEGSAPVPRRFLDDRRVRWEGAVSRSGVMRYYQDADVLVFPSLSDGFGMVQVEAQGWQLPIIASRSCGTVVQDGVNGLLLPDVTPTAIAAAVRKVAGDPRLLERFSRASAVTDRLGVPALGASLLALGARPTP